MIRKYLKSILVLCISLNFLKSQTLQDIQKLKSEYDKLKEQSSTNIMNDAIDDNDKQKPSLIDVFPYKGEILEDSLIQKTRYFGYDFFIKRDTLGFWENLPVPSSYTLGPGDEIIISLWGETSLRQSFTISRSGKIYDEKVGVIGLSGKSISDAKIHILNEYGRIYSTLKNNKPTTFLDISLGNLKSINVNFFGNANFPGLYAIHPFSNLITGLIQIGGIDTTGSLRTIKIKRNNEIIKDVDLYDYLLKGNLSGNIQLKDQDIVLIDFRKSTIEIDSSVYRPGFYESLPGETIFELINYAGGLKPDASNKVSIMRITPREKRNQEIPNNYNAYYEYENTNKIAVQDGDKIIINKMLENIQEVEMIGQVKRPGKYSFYQGMSLFDLIELGGGFDDSTFWKSVYHSQAEIVRREPNTRYEKVIKVNLNKINDVEYFKNIKLNNLDRFVVHSNLNFFEKKNIEIYGEVNIPGSYPIILNNESLRSIIGRAGGLTPKALKNGISIFRDKDYFYYDEKFSNEEDKSNKIRVAWQSDQISLMPGDSIIVLEKTRTINVIGEVYNPGLIEFKENKSVERYINDAGGITEFGNRKSIIIIYANGVTLPKRWYSSPKILDGCTIIVNKKEPSEPFDITQFATNWTQIASSLITAIVLTQQISQSN